MASDTLYRGPFPVTVLDWHDGDTVYLRTVVRKQVDAGFYTTATVEVSIDFWLRIEDRRAAELWQADGPADRDRIASVYPAGTPMQCKTALWKSSGEYQRSFIRFKGPLFDKDGVNVNDAVPQPPRGAGA